MTETDIRTILMVKRYNELLMASAELTTASARLERPPMGGGDAFSDEYQAAVAEFAKCADKECSRLVDEAGAIMAELLRWKDEEKEK